MAKYCIASPHKDETWYDYRILVNLKASLAQLGHTHVAGAKNRIYFLGGPLKRFYPKVGEFDTEANNLALIYCHMQKLHRLDIFSKVFVPSAFVKHYYEQRAKPNETDEDVSLAFQTQAPIDIIRPFTSLKPVNEFRPKFACDVMFMGTPRIRPIVEAMLSIVEKHSLKMHIIGPSWPAYPGNASAKNYWTDRQIPYFQIPQAVKGAKICLHDHHASMNQFETCSHKYIEMVSAGGFVISDNNADVKNVYAGLTFENENQLEEMVLTYLQNEEKRLQKIAQQQVLMKDQTTLRAAQMLSQHFV